MGRGAVPEIACLNPSLDMTPLPAVLKLFQWMPRLFLLLLLPTHRFFQQRFLKVRRVRSRYDDVIVFPKTFSDDSVLSALELLHGRISRAHLKATCHTFMHSQGACTARTPTPTFRHRHIEAAAVRAVGANRDSKLLQLDSIRAPS